MKGSRKFKTEILYNGENIKHQDDLTENRDRGGDCDSISPRCPETSRPPHFLTRIPPAQEG